MDHIRAIAWNGQVQHILSTASTNGYTIVWDIRNKKEIMALPQHPAVISSIAWHPDIVKRVIIIRTFCNPSFFSVGDTDRYCCS